MRIVSGEQIGVDAGDRSPEGRMADDGAVPARYPPKVLRTNPGGRRALALLAGLLCTFLAACDYTVPLVTRPAVDVDRAGAGLWERTRDDGQHERLLVLLLDEHRYLVSYPAGADNAMFATASFWRGAGMTLVQLDWFGAADGTLPDSDRTFQYAAYSLEDDSLRIRLLNPDVVDRHAGSPAALRDAIESNRDDPNLFRNELLFRRSGAGG